MEKIKRLFTETFLVAFLTVFSYFLFLLKDSGYLNAFGLFDTSGFVSLQVQNVIPSVIVIIALTLELLTILFIFLGVVQKLVKKRSNNVKTIASLANMFIVLLLTSSPILVGVYLTDRRLFIQQIIFLAIFYTILFVILPLVQRWRTKKDYQTALISITNPLDNILGKISKDINTRMAILATIILLMMLPLFSYSFGFISARLQKNFYISGSDNEKYVVVRQYGNQVILVRIDGNKVLPIYKIEYLDSSNSLDFRSTPRSTLDFSQVNSLTRRGLTTIF